MGKKLHKRMNGEEVKIHQHDNYQMPGAYKQDGDKNKNQPMFNVGKPYKMGMSMRGPLDKHGMSQDHKMAYDRAEISRLKHDIWYDDAKKHDSKGTEMRGPLNQAKPDYIDIDGDGNKKESMKQAAAQKGPEMRGPLNQTKQAGFRPMTVKEAVKVAQQANAEAAAESAGELGKNQKLKTKMEKKITKKKPTKA